MRITRILMTATVAGTMLAGAAAARAQGYGYQDNQGYGYPQGGYGYSRDGDYNQGYARPLSQLAIELGYRQEAAYQSDRRYARQAQAQALSYPQIQYVIRWSNPQTGNHGETFVAGEGQDGAGHRCRDMQETLNIQGRHIVNKGLACYVNGRWSTVG